MALKKSKVMMDRMEREEAGEAEPKTYMGRPVKEVNWEDLDKLIYIGAAQAEIAEFFNMHIETLSRRIREKMDCTFADYAAFRRNGYKLRLRKRLNSSKSASILKFLAKNHLGMVERVEIVDGNESSSESEFERRLREDYERKQKSRIANN